MGKVAGTIALAVVVAIGIPAAAQESAAADVAAARAAAEDAAAPASEAPQKDYVAEDPIGVLESLQRHGATIATPNAYGLDACELAEQLSNWLQRQRGVRQAMADWAVERAAQAQAVARDPLVIQAGAAAPNALGWARDDDMALAKELRHMVDEDERMIATLNALKASCPDPKSSPVATPYEAPGR